MNFKAVLNGCTHSFRPVDWNPDTWSRKDLRQFRKERKLAFSRFGSPHHQMRQHHDLYERYDMAAKRLLLDPNGAWSFFDMDMPKRRSTWAAYVEEICSATSSLVDMDKSLDPPVSDMADRIAIVMSWSKNETNPPFPFPTPSILHAMVQWTEHHHLALREVC